MAKTKKYYVVWDGVQPGVFETWAECKVQIDGFKGAKYKSYPTLMEAEKAFESGFTKDKFSSSKPSSKPTTRAGKPILASISVDAACSGNPGAMEYQGVNTSTKEQIFHKKFPLGTNNIGEFLALVHGISLMQQKGLKMPIYTDSKIAMAWIKKKKCGSKLPETSQTKDLYAFVRRAEKWLQENAVTVDIRKWETKLWGEIPADFGRK